MRVCSGAAAGSGGWSKGRKEHETIIRDCDCGCGSGLAWPRRKRASGSGGSGSSAEVLRLSLPARHERHGRLSARWSYRQPDQARARGHGPPATQRLKWARLEWHSPRPSLSLWAAQLEVQKLEIARLILEQKPAPGAGRGPAIMGAYIYLRNRRGLTFSGDSSIEAGCDLRDR